MVLVSRLFGLRPAGVSTRLGETCSRVQEQPGITHDLQETYSWVVARQLRPPASPLSPNWPTSAWRAGAVFPNKTKSVKRRAVVPGSGDSGGSAYRNELRPVKAVAAQPR